jgi:hypothetical protein
MQCTSTAPNTQHTDFIVAPNGADKPKSYLPVLLMKNHWTVFEGYIMRINKDKNKKHK